MQACQCFIARSLDATYGRGARLIDGLAAALACLISTPQVHLEHLLVLHIAGCCSTYMHLPVSPSSSRPFCISFVALHTGSGCCSDCRCMHEVCESPTP
jgi:hypothetical protein